MSDLIDLRVANRVAARFSSPGALAESYLLDGLQASFEEIVREAEPLIAEESGFSPPIPAVARVLSRQEWASANVESMLELMAPLLGKVEERLASRGAPGAKMAYGAGLGAQLGIVLGFLSQRVLGQYDILMSHQNQVWFVGPNIVLIERQHGFIPRDFRLWVALHELTHRAQFESNTWVRPYFLSLVTQMMGSIDMDAKTFLDRLVTATKPSEPGEAVVPLAFRLLEPEQREIFNRLQAFMSVIEGHGNFVMDKAAEGRIPSQPRMSKLLRGGATMVGPVAKIIGKVLGFELKRAQYQQGQLFFDAVYAAAGAGRAPDLFRGGGEAAHTRGGAGAGSVADADGLVKASAAETIERFVMLQPGQRVLVAFSGGADSTALAVLLSELGYQVVLGHVDHGLRPESEAEVDHCREAAARLGCEFLFERVHVDPPTQAEARRVRYAALERMAAAAGAPSIATGHTLDDQAETVLMRLDRGGFALGIPPVRGNVVRPMIGLRRRQIEQVCERAGIPYLTDPSNSNPRYTRVRVRRRLAAMCDAEVLELAAAGDQAREQAGALTGIWSDLVDVQSDRAFVDRNGLAALEPADAGQILHRTAAALDIELTKHNVRDILGKVLTVTGAQLDLEGGRRAWSERDVLVLGRWTPASVLPSIAVNLPGVTVAGEWGLQIDAVPVPPSSPRSPSRYEEVLDAAALCGPLEIRQWRPGDRFQPLGSVGSKKLQDFFVDEGVPRRLRPAVPVLAAGDRIAWVVGHRIDDRVRITPGTERAIRITVGPPAPRRLEPSEHSRMAAL